MRLAQLSKKVNARTTDIQKFLQEKFGSEFDDMNMKLEQDHVEAAIAQFGERSVRPTGQLTLDAMFETGIRENTPPLTDENKSHVEHGPDIVASAEEIMAVDTGQQKIEELTSPEHQAAEESPFDLNIVDGVIKAPKVKLEGLKVLGRIELPAKKLKTHAESTLNEPLDSSSEADSVAEEVPPIVEKEEPDAEQTPVTPVTGDALVAELDQALAKNKQRVKSLPQKAKVAKEVQENQNSDEESSIYKDDRGIYHFTLTQIENRRKALMRIKENKKQTSDKTSKQKHYQQLMSERQMDSKMPETKKKPRLKAEAAVPKKEAKGVFSKFLRWLND